MVDWLPFPTAPDTDRNPLLRHAELRLPRPSRSIAMAFRIQHRTSSPLHRGIGRIFDALDVGQGIDLDTAAIPEGGDHVQAPAQLLNVAPD